VNAGAPTIAITRLRELWLHTGTSCNLSCPFCHEGSKPGDTRLQAFTLAEIAPVLQQAVQLGVERFAFTGGEPLILRDVHSILVHALQLAPVLVLTNGTAPFIRRAHQLATLRTQPHALSFRVSIDYPDEAQHDAGRGLKNFRKAIEGLRLLHAAGFAVGITRQQQPGEDAAAISNRFRNLLRKQRLPEDLPIVALPDLGALTTATVAANEPNATTSIAATTFAIEPVCSRSRMLLRRDGELRLHACPLTDDEKRFDVGPTLAAAMKTGVVANHARCTLCLNPGVDYAGINATP
jgi:sulfatase maturation enzyme AslB (radical SAM superfamily)